MTRNTKLSGILLALTLTATVFSGCAGPAKTSKAEQPAPVVTMLTGKVVETMDAGGYTYINLEKDGKQTWVAAPAMKVSVGQEMKLLPGAVMHNFPSNALKRTFETIVFSGGLPEAAGAVAATKDESGVVESTEPVLTGKVTETMDAANYTYIKVEKDGKFGWSAVPGSEFSVGDEVEVLPGTVMGQFTSKSLKRTFNQIYFASGAKVLKAAHPEKPAAKPGVAAKTVEAAKAPGEQAAPAATPPLPAGHPKIDAAAVAAASASAPAASADNALTGKVVETADAAGYTYLCLEKAGKKTWVAVPTMKVAVGQEVTLAPGMVMTNFVSKGLNRTFESIVFSNGPQ